MNFTIDQDKCTQCNKCSSICPVKIINHKTEYPEIKEGKAKNCMKCQHCLAICPTGALSIWDKNPKNSLPITTPIAETQNMANLMQLRRSIRDFNNQEVDGETIKYLLTAAAYAPSAKNENAVNFTVIDNRKTMDSLREKAYSAIKRKSEAGDLPKQLGFMDSFQSLWFAKQLDIVFRNAPHILITSAPKKGTAPQTDSTIATTYFDLLANSAGIKTLWTDFAKYILEEISPEIKSELNIPEENTIHNILVFGNSDIDFKRSIQNDNPNINIATL